MKLIISLCLFFFLMSIPCYSFQVSMKWIVVTGGTVYATPTLHDTNSDGIAEVIVGSSDNLCYVVDGKKGEVIKKFSSDSSIRHSAAVADFDGDSKVDVVFGATSGNLFAYSLSNGLIWKCSTGRDPASGSPALCDVNRDGTPDIIIPFTKNIFAVDGRKGTVLWSFDGKGEILSTPALCDINSDGVEDVFAGNSFGQMFCIDGKNGMALWNFTTREKITSSPAVGDVDSDGFPEVVFGSTSKELYVLKAKDGGFLWKFQNKDVITLGPVITKVDDDEHQDILFATEDKFIYALAGNSGKKFFRHKTGHRLNDVPALIDVEGDSRPELLFTCLDQTMSIIRIARADSGRMDRDVLLQSFEGQRNNSYGSIVGGDIDQDGKIELVVCSGSKINAFSTEKTCVKGLLPWSTLKGNFSRDSFYREASVKKVPQKVTNSDQSSTVLPASMTPAVPTAVSSIDIKTDLIKIKLLLKQGKTEEALSKIEAVSTKLKGLKDESEKKKIEQTIDEIMKSIQ